MFDLVRDAAKIGVGAVLLSRENLKKLTDNLAEMGNASKDEGEKLFNDLAEMRDQYHADARKAAEEAVRQALDAAGLVRKEEYEALAARVAELESKLAGSAEGA